MRLFLSLVATLLAAAMTQAHAQAPAGHIPNLYACQRFGSSEQLTVSGEIQG